MTRNQDLNVLHVNNATEFANSVTARVVRGDSLIFDFIYFLHPARPRIPKLDAVDNLSRDPVVKRKGFLTHFGTDLMWSGAVSSRTSQPNEGQCMILYMIYDIPSSIPCE